MFVGNIAESVRFFSIFLYSCLTHTHVGCLAANDTAASMGGGERVALMLKSDGNGMPLFRFGMEKTIDEKGRKKSGAFSTKRTRMMKHM